MNKKLSFVLLIALVFLFMGGSLAYSQMAQFKTLTVKYKNIETGQYLPGGKFVVENDCYRQEATYVEETYRSVLRNANTSYLVSSFDFGRVTDIAVYPVVPAGYNVITPRQFLTGNSQTIIFECEPKVYGGSLLNQDNVYFEDSKENKVLDGGIVMIIDEENEMLPKIFMESPGRFLFSRRPPAFPKPMKGWKVIAYNFPFGYGGERNFTNNSENFLQVEPTKIPLQFYTDYQRDAHIVKGDYNGIRIGEYLWVDNNFNHPMPKRFADAEDIRNFPWWYEKTYIGTEQDYPITRETLRKYMDCYPPLPRTALDWVNIDEYNKYYGIYYSRESAEHMEKFGRMREKGIENSSWRFPLSTDFQQLFGMCEVHNGTWITNHDIHLDLSVKKNDNPMAKPMDGVGWFDQTRNRYKFNMMPSGARLPKDENWTNGKNPVGGWVGSLGDVYHLFQSVYFHTGDQKAVSIHDLLQFPNKSWHWYSVRFCRELTNEELGYRLYVNNNNENEIIKLNLYETPPSNYRELEKGYLRGLYVQYILNNPNPTKTVSQLRDIVTRTWINNTPRSSLYPILKEATGIEEVKQQSAVFTYPNPVIDEINVNGEFIKVELRSLNGNTVLSTTESVISISHLRPGMYIMHIEAPAGNIVEKIIKK